MSLCSSLSLSLSLPPSLTLCFFLSPLSHSLSACLSVCLSLGLCVYLPVSVYFYFHGLNVLRLSAMWSKLSCQIDLVRRLGVSTGRTAWVFNCLNSIEDKWFRFQSQHVTLCNNAQLRTYQALPTGSVWYTFDSSHTPVSLVT